MDANGLRFWMLSTEEQWQRLGDPPQTQYDEECQVLRLARERSLPPWSLVDPTGTTLESDALSRLEQVPQTQDGFGTRAYWDSAARRVRATGAIPGTVDLLAPAASPTDLAMGYDGVLYLAIGGQILLQDRRDRWQPVFLSEPGFTAQRLAADPDGGVWALDRDRRQLGRVQGRPLPTRPSGEHAPDIFRPCLENPDPPRLTLFSLAAIPGDEKAVAIACNLHGRLALLTWQVDGTARLRALKESGQWTLPVTLEGCRYPYSLTWVTGDRIAVLVSYLNTEAAVYAVPELAQGRAKDGDRVQPVGDFYPLRNYHGAPFLQGISPPPHYLVGSNLGSETAPLYPLSLPSYARQGEAIAPTAFDSGNPTTQWHRLYLEAVIPANCGIQVYLSATDTPIRPAETDPWFEHRFGARFSPGDRKIPQGAWVSVPSEIPYHPGLLNRPPEKHRTGLFTVLIQRSDRQVHTLQGRYLWVRVVLTGDGRTTPQIAALRAYGSRFSYVNEYLPQLYHEATFGADRDVVGSSTPADFLERFLDNFEGILTPLEDRIASSYLLTDPRTAPDEAIDWLAGWIGMSFDPAYSPKQRRRLIAAAPDLYRERGTLAGLRRSIDLATQGAVSGGEIVVLEDFRLRRTFATILGADLTETDDPLTGGLSISGNSFVGDSLFLGDESKKEFLSVFGAGLPVTAAEQSAIAAFFDQLAYRVTVLVHNQIEPQDLGLIRRVVEQETPAHVLSRVVTATYPFIVSIASLVGVDTYLAAKPQPRPVRLGTSQLGTRDLLQRPPSLDPRLESGIDSVRLDLQLPVAIATAPPDVPPNSSIRLDAAASVAPTGRTISRYIWTLLPAIHSP